MNGKYVDDATKIERASPAIAQAASRGRSAVVTPGLNQDATAGRFRASFLAPATPAGRELALILEGQARLNDLRVAALEPIAVGR